MLFTGTGVVLWWGFDVWAPKEATQLKDHVAKQIFIGDDDAILLTGFIKSHSQIIFNMALFSICRKI